MSLTLIAILLGAGLFALFGLLPHRGCDGHCAGCTAGSCERLADEGEHHDR